MPAPDDLGSGPNSGSILSLWENSAVLAKNGPAYLSAPPILSNTRLTNEIDRATVEGIDDLCVFIS